MKCALLLPVVLALPGCCQPVCCPKASQRSPPSVARSATDRADPETVSALRYRIWISDGGIRASHIGHWAEALWFPEWELEVNIEPEQFQGRPRLHTFHSEFPHASTQAGAVWIPTGEDPRRFYRGPRETVEVPWALARRIKAAFDLQARLEKQRGTLGGEVELSGLNRAVTEGDTRQ